MELKDFRPTTRKILTTLILIGISILAIIVPPFILLFYFLAILLFNLPSTIIIFILISYLFGCYISKNRNWFRGISGYLVVLITIPIGIFFIINAYNGAVGHSCNTDSDCQWTCEDGAINGKYIRLRDQFVSIDCFSTEFAVCENNRCRSKTGTTLEQLEKKLERLQQKIRIDNITASVVTIKNTGTKDIPLNQIIVFVNGEQKCTIPNIIKAGTTANCTIGACPSGSIVRATAPGNNDEVTCS